MSKKEMTTEKRLKVRLYLSLLVYTVVGYGLTLILDYIFSKFDNGIFAWLYRRLDLLFYFVSDDRLCMYFQLLLEKAVGLSG